MNCDLVPSGIKLQTNGTFSVAASCRKETAQCHLPDFLIQQASQLRAIADYLDGHPRAVKQQDRVEHLLSAVLTDPNLALGQATCWALGDVIIALQVPTNAAIWTIDADFMSLATALGLKMYAPSV